MYDKIFNCLIEAIKNLSNTNEKYSVSAEVAEKLKHLRVPLCSFIQYKGIAALAIEEPSGDIEQTSINSKE